MAEKKEDQAAPADVKKAHLAAVDSWVQEQLHNSPVSQAGAHVWNHMTAAVEDLKRRIREA